MTFDLSTKRIVVTGGAGFLGSFVVEKLKARGCKHIVVPRSSDYDLVDLSAVRRLLSETCPDVIIHLAAVVGGIGANQKNPARFFYDNLLMGVQLLHEAHRFSVQKFVATATICAYPKHCPVPFREEDLWNGYPEETNAPYGLAKKMLLLQSAAYRAQYGFSSVVLFPVNLYGPRDHFDLETSHVIPALIRKIAQAQEQGLTEVTIWGDGSPTREFLYVEDCAEAIVLATERYDQSDPVNVGSGQEISIAALAGKIGDLMGYKGGFVYDKSRPNGQPRRLLDTTRAERCFGFRARTTLDEGLRSTIDFFQREFSP
ncbi:MAG TPA: GDP-L-fucose synthase [Pseudomonadota bacterium]|nr:GDP-L-fucose synthase [Pseudomonadota bacterium]